MNAEDTFKKENGIFYTGKFLARKMINLLAIDYKKSFTLIEPAVGEGHILSLIVETYFEKNKDKLILEQEDFLVNNIFAFDLRLDAVKKTILKLNKLSNKYIGKDIEWNVEQINAIDVDKLVKYYKKFDYVISNPPYVSRKNMDNGTATFLRENSEFANKYNYDLYYYFFEIGINFWNNAGKIVYITPNSYLRARGSEDMLKYFVTNQLIEKIIDFEDELVFENASIYSAITILSKYNKKIIVENSQAKEIKTYEYTSLHDNYIYNFYNHEFDIKFKDDIDGFFYLQDISEVRNGIATLQDKIFIIKNKEIIKEENKFVYFNKNNKEYKIEKGICFKTIRPSKLEDGDLVIFPFKNELENSSEFIKNIRLNEEFPFAFEYLCSNLSYEFKEKYQIFWGRTQGMKASQFTKIVIPTIANLDCEAFKIVDEGFVVAGISIVINNKYSKYIKNINDYLNSSSVIDYLKDVSKNYSSGYKSISSTDLKRIKIPTKILES